MDVRDQVLNALRASVKPEIFDVWCRELAFEPDGEGVTIPVANPFIKEMYERELRAPIEEAVLAVYGRRVTVLFTVRPTAVPPPVTPAPAVRGLQLNPTLTFDRFLVGPSNRFAQAASMAVAESPGAVYNPLFIHGSVGLGKTHLLQAICQALLKRNPSLKIFFLPCETFVNEYIRGVRQNNLEPFRARYRSADALFLDDIHFLAGKESSQEEFFHTYNALHGSGKQIVLASDAPPADIQLLQQQLMSRFRSGLVARVDAPTFEERVALIDTRAQERGHELPAEVNHFLAGAVQTNFRELEGAVTKLIAFAVVSKHAVDLDLARQVVREFAPSPRAPIGVARIQKVVADYFKMPVAELAARRWTKSTSLPRQAAIYLARQFTNHSLKEIGAHFGGKDHATVVYAIRRVEKLAAGHPHVRAQLDALTRLVRELL